MELGEILIDDNGNRLIAVPIVNKKNPCEGCFYNAKGSECNPLGALKCWDKDNNDFILIPARYTENQSKESDAGIPEHPVDSRTKKGAYGVFLLYESGTWAEVKSGDNLKDMEDYALTELMNKEYIIAKIIRRHKGKPEEFQL